MDRLDACYFCGTAGEAPLREVSIAPRARRGDPDATVATTLCPSCEGKLETVLGRLFDHVETRRAQGEEAGAATDESDGAGTAEEGGAAAGEGADTAADEPDHRVDRIDVLGEQADEQRGPRGTRSPRDRRRLFDRSADIRDVPDTDSSEDASAAGDDGPSDAAGADESDSAAEDPTGEDAEIVADEDDEPTVRARASATAGGALEGVSVAEYNRVMRLLQNREFPMAREAFVDLASSAYDLAEGTVQQVLDAVVDKGALAERDGDLVQPGQAGEEPP